jgi:hypothetical protein
LQLWADQGRLLQQPKADHKQVDIMGVALHVCVSIVANAEAIQLT